MEQLYRYNQIPAIIVGPKDLDEPNWDKELYAKLEQVARQGFDPMQYASESIPK